MNASTNVLKNITLLAVFLLYLASLILPAFYPEQWCAGIPPEPGATYYGWMVLLIGWLGILTGTIGWYANIGLIISIILYIKESRHCFKWTLISFLIALSSLAYTMGYHDGGAFTENVSHFGSGFVVWLSCFIVLLLAQIIQNPAGFMQRVSVYNDK